MCPSGRRKLSAVAWSDPYTIDASSQPVIELMALAGVLVPGPVFGSIATRLSGMVVPGGSESPAGTVTEMLAPLGSDFSRSRSWSMNWPQAYIMSDSAMPCGLSRLPGGLPRTTMLLIARGLGPGCMTSMPSAKLAGPTRAKSVSTALSFGSDRLLPDPSTVRN
jgi:hypothetical protein